MPFDPYNTDNPALPFVRFMIGGKNILDIPPQRLISFTNSKTAGKSDFSLELFSSEWGEIETIILESDRTVMYDYGYSTAGQLRSAVMNGTILDSSMRLDSNGVYITLKGVGVAEYKCMGNVNSDGHTKMLISEIVAKLITDEMGGEVGGVEETVPVMSTDSAFDDLEPANRVWERHNMNAIAYIEKILAPWAVSTKDGMSGYKLFQDTTDGKWYFKPIRVDDAIIRDYIVYRDSRGDVKSFTFEYKWLVNRVLGNGKISASGIDPNTKESYVVTYNPLTDGVCEATGDSTVAVDNATGENASATVINAPSDDPLKLAEYLKALGQMSNASTFSASLEIIGDPTIVPYLNYARIYVFDKEKNLHVVSGLYTVQSAVDSINSSGFSTSLTLSRNSIRVGVDPVTAERMKL